MIRNLQCLRAIAALLVVFVHLGGILATIGLPAFGGGGVDLFFVISGFVMVHTTMTKRPSAAVFFRNRLARVMPFYWAMTVLAFLVSVLSPGLMRETDDYTLVKLAKSLLFIPYMKSNGLMQPVLFVGWTLNYEMFFYMLFSLGLLLRTYVQTVASILLTLSCLAASRLFTVPEEPVMAYYTNPIVLEFGLGMGVALAIDRVLVHRSITQPVALAVLAPSFVAILLCPVRWPEVSSLVTAGLPAALLVGSAVAIDGCGWSLRSVLLLAIGDASYALYLSHPYVTQVAETVRQHVHLRGWQWMLIIVGTVPLTIVLAVILNRVLERRIYRATRQLLGTRRLTLPVSTSTVSGGASGVLITPCEGRYAGEPVHAGGYDAGAGAVD